MSSLWFRCAPKPVFPLWCPNMSALPTPLSVTLIPAWKFLLQIPICGTVKINSWSGFLFRIWIVPWGLSTGNPRGGLPFNVEIPNYSQQTLEAMEEAKGLSQDPNVKGYQSMEELKKALEE